MANLHDLQGRVDPQPFMGFTLVPLPDSVKEQLVDQAVSEGLASWIVNDDGSVAVALNAGSLKFMPQQDTD